MYAASDSRPRQPREIALCNEASTTDWTYVGGLLGTTVLSIALDTVFFRKAGDQRDGESYEAFVARTEGNLGYPATRTVGAGLVGLSVGGLIGGTWLALPKCDRSFAYGPPPEGSARSLWPTALTLAMASAAMGPLVVAIETGAPYNKVLSWPVSERAVHFIVPAFTGFLGALIPYLLPPRTWRAAREIERIRAGTTPDGHGAFVGYSLRF